MKKVTLILATVGLLVGLTGCNEDKKAEAEPVQTVDWYKEHTTERRAMLDKCNNNPGELAATPNCVNASRAESSLTWSARGGVKTPAPLTADDLRK